MDVDEVLADFQTPAFKIIRQLTGRTYTPHDFTVWDIFSVLGLAEVRAVLSEMEKPGFCLSLKPTEGAVEAIQEVRSIADVYVVTSPQHNRHWVYERTEWLMEHFGFDKAHIIHTVSKYMIRGDAFLDDKPEHVEAWTSENSDGLAMLWHIPNTRNLGRDLLRVHSWTEVVTKVRELAEVQHGSG